MGNSERWFYETGLEIPEILGSGSDKSNVFVCTDQTEAFAAYGTGGRNYLLRWRVEHGCRVTERYDAETGGFRRD